MPVVENIARCAPLEPGVVRFSLLKFNGAQNLGNYISGIELLIVRRNDDLLADWPKVNSDGFLRIQPRSSRQRALDFEFEVGPEVVNPMAFDNSGDYILKIRAVDGIIRSFAVAMQGTPRADNSFVFVNKNQASQMANYGEEKANTFTQQKEMVEDNNINRDNNIPNIPGDMSPEMAPEMAPNMPHDIPNIDMPISNNKSSSSGGIAKIIGLVVFLIILAAAIYFALKSFSLLGNDDASTSVEENISSNANENDNNEVSGSTNFACQLNGQNITDVEIINRCLSSKPSDDDVYNFLRDALNNNRCEIALRLLRTKGRGSDIQGAYFAYIYGQLADPKQVNKSSCIVKSNEDANYWRRKALEHKDFDRNEAHQRFIQVISKSE